ncbi:MAG: 30S ribosomal protein S16 [Cyclobacteriaceae bacterium]|nr:30S ribosomal protein S16 [Cyclobacteriaceae bacterium]
MAVKIRLTRRGRKKRVNYDVIVADSRSPRDGRLIEKLGTYNPLSNPATIVLNEEKTLDWLLKGAQPTDTVKRILSYKGIMLKKHLQIGVLKGAITQEAADAKFEEWLKGKESAITSKVDSLARKKADEAKARLEAEKKVNEAKAEALRQKNKVAEPEPEVVETPEEAVAEAAETVENAEVEEAAEVVETPASVETTEEAPKVEEEKVEEVKAEAATEEPKAEESPVAEAPAADEAEEEEKK